MANCVTILLPENTTLWLFRAGLDVTTCGKIFKNGSFRNIFYYCNIGTKLFYGCQVVLFFHNNLHQNVTMFRL